MKLPNDVPLGSAESRRLLREMAVGLIAISDGAEIANLVAAKPAPPQPAPEPKPAKVQLPSDVPKVSAESRRLLKEATAGSRQMLEETKRANKQMIHEAQAVAEAAKNKAQRAMATTKAPKPLKLPTDVPEDSAEGRTRLSDYKNKGLYTAPIKNVPFKPRFDNEPTMVHSVKA